VWSNGNTELTPQKGSAFYVNSTAGFGLNTNNPQAALDIANGGLAFNKVYQLSEIFDVNIAGVHTVVQKDGKQGVCGYNGSTWVPLTLNAEREGLCTASTQSTPPKHATSTISGAVQFSGQPVITNGTTLLHQVWSGGMNNNHGGWINHPWIYKHTGPLDNGDYRCGIGFHMGNPTPDGMKNTDCKACSPITNQRDWRSNGKNDDCDFSCKAGFKKVGRTCTACEVGTYTTDGTVANSCASCTNKPANAHYTTNGINANACQWACDAGYHNVG
jgi:nucleoside diphosphate kinase, putative